MPSVEPLSIDDQLPRRPRVRIECGDALPGELELVPAGDDDRGQTGAHVGTCEGGLTPQRHEIRKGLEHGCTRYHRNGTQRESHEDREEPANVRSALGTMHRQRHRDHEGKNQQRYTLIHRIGQTKLRFAIGTVDPIETMRSIHDLRITCYSKIRVNDCFSRTSVLCGESSCLLLSRSAIFIPAS